MSQSVPRGGVEFASPALMARKNTVLQNIYPYGVTARSNNQDWFAIPLDECWDIFEEVIELTAKKYGIRTHAFVLMSNHFHWLISTPEANLGFAMRYFMTESSRRLARASGRINKIYGARYKATLLQEPPYYANTYRYFYQNPLRAGICSDVDHYRWSTRAQRSRVEISACEALEEYIPRDKRQLAAWLNRIPEGPYQLLMRSALRRAEFRYPRHPKTKLALDELTFLK